MRVRVWMVRERDLLKGVEQDLFILAGGLPEALEVASTAVGREVVAAQEVCPITECSGDRYRVTPVIPRP